MTRDDFPIIRLDGREYVPAPLARDERARAEAAEARAADLERQLEECNRLRVDALHKATAEEQAATMAREGRATAEVAFNRACNERETAETTLGDVANALGVPLADRPEGIAGIAKAWRDRADTAEARVVELEAAQRWRPVTERPSRRTVAAVCRLDERGWRPVIGVYVAHGPDAGWYVNGLRCDDLITHYLPLDPGPGPEVKS